MSKLYLREHSLGKAIDAVVSAQLLQEQRQVRVRLHTSTYVSIHEHT